MKRPRLHLATIDGVPVPERKPFATYTVERAQEQARARFRRIADQESPTPEPDPPPRVA